MNRTRTQGHSFLRVSPNTPKVSSLKDEVLCPRFYTQLGFGQKTCRPEVRLPGLTALGLFPDYI